jgi:hypothetical protein
MTEKEILDHEEIQFEIEELSHLTYIKGLEDKELSDEEAVQVVIKNPDGSVVPKYNVYGGKKQDGEVFKNLNPFWAADSFDAKFLAFVRQAHGHYIPIPFGRVTDEEAPHELLTNVPVHYNQGTQDLCLAYSLSSCLHYCGYRGAGNSLKQMKVKDFAAFISINKILEGVKNNCPEIGAYEVFNTHKARGSRKLMTIEEILSTPTRYPTLLILIGKDGSTNHAVTVVDDLIFDSTQKFALKLKKESFDWICGGEGIAAFNAVYRFHQKYCTKREFTHQS